jgi:hypothetical protein
MAKKALDLLIVLLSGGISFLISISHPEFGNMEMGALLLVYISIGVTILTVITYLIIAIFFRKFYSSRHWPIITILAAINILAGILIYLNDW